MSLEELAQQIRRCKKCNLWQGAINAVPGEGPAMAKAMLLGQNPGAEEDKTGRPFVGRSGRYLDSVLVKNGINRKDLFITGVVKHVTPKNRRPSDAEIYACLPHVMKQIMIIKPRIIFLMGEVARTVPRWEGIKYIETCHPAAAMRFPKYRRIFEDDFRKFYDAYSRISD